MSLQLKFRQIRPKYIFLLVLVVLLPSSVLQHILALLTYYKLFQSKYFQVHFFPQDWLKKYSKISKCTFRGFQQNEKYQNDLQKRCFTNTYYKYQYIKPLSKNQEKLKLKSLENEKSIEILNYRGFLVIEYLQTTNLCWFPINSSQNWYSAKLTNKFHIGQMTPPSAFSQFYLKMCHF